MRASGRGWTACPERPSGSRPARMASKRNSVSPGAAWVPPMGSPHPRSVCVPSWGASKQNCADGVLFPPHAGPRVKARLAQTTWGRGDPRPSPRGEAPADGVLPLKTQGFLSFSASGAEPGRTAGEKAPSERSSCLEVRGPSDKRPDSQSTRAFSHRR